MTTPGSPLRPATPQPSLHPRSPAKENGRIGDDYSAGTPEHLVVWKRNPVSVTYGEVDVEKIRRFDKGCDRTKAHEITLTGTFDPQTAIRSPSSSTSARAIPRPAGSIS